MIGTSRNARVVTHVRRDFVAIHARHLDVEQDHVGHVVLQQGHGLDAVLGRHDAHAVALEQPLRDAAHRDRIVDDQREDAVVACLAQAFGGAGAPFGPHQSAHVEDDDDATITQDRGAGNAADSGDLRTDGLHDDLATADELIGHERGRMFASPDQDHRKGVSVSGSTEGAAPTKLARCWKR